jgi:hypothetical protein
MNIKLMCAALAVLGLVACGPDITPEAGTKASTSEASDAPAQPAAAASTTQEEKKDEAAAPIADEKANEGDKKAE